MTWQTGNLHYFTTPSWTTTEAGDSLKEVSKGTASSTISSKSSHKSGKTALIVGIVIAAVVALIFITALVCIVRCCLRRRSRKQANTREPDAASGGLLNRGWQKVDGEEKLGDEDFGGMSYNARDKLLTQDVPVYNARGMAYEPFRSVPDKE